MMYSNNKHHKVKRTIRFLVIIVLVIGGLSNVAFGEMHWNDPKNLSTGTGWGTAVGPALVNFNGTLYGFVKGTDSKIYYYSSNDGTNWGGLSSIPGQSTTHTPAVEVFNNRIYCIYKALSSQNIVVTSSSDGASWSSPYYITPRLTPVTPSIAVFNGRLYCVVKGSTTNYIYVFSTGDGSNWNASYTIPNITSAAGPAVAVFNNRLYCAVRGLSNEQLYIVSCGDGTQASWSAASSIPNQTTPFAPALQVFRNKLYCIYKASTSTRLISTDTSDGQNWSAAVDVGNMLSTHTPGLDVFDGKMYCHHKSSTNTNIFVGDGTDTILNVPLYTQQTNMWCWAASGEMIMTYLGTNNDIRQCTQANNYLNRNDCCNNFQNCVQGGWPEFDSYGFNFQSTNWGTALTFAQLITEFENNRPVGFTWGWAGGGGHYMVARGAFENDANEQFVHVNDPWPWNADRGAGGTATLITYDEFVAVPGVHSTWCNDYNIR